MLCLCRDWAQMSQNINVGWGVDIAGDFSTFHLLMVFGFLLYLFSQK
jgi:hypothetical protein